MGRSNQGRSNRNSIDAADSDEDEDNDGDDPEEADDEATSSDEDRFCRQVLKIQEKAFARFSVLLHRHRQRKLLNRLQKTTTYSSKEQKHQSALPSDK